MKKLGQNKKEASQKTCLFVKPKFPGYLTSVSIYDDAGTNLQDPVMQSSSALE